MPHSPYVTTYEGDLVQPRYEDPKGHAVGVPAPGGSIIRTDTNASFVEMVAGGFRNPYDFTFNADGELFTYDADMEWDIGSPWYRPTRLVHVTPGGEYGWRSGWAKWPAYYLDSLPATADMGPGSPTGMVYYNHTAYPPRLQNTLFVADWALGQIHAVKLERNGATYKAKVLDLSERPAAECDGTRCGAGRLAVLLRRAVAAPMAASIACGGRATGRRRIIASGREFSRRSTSHNCRAIGRGPASRRSSGTWAIVGRPNWNGFSTGQAQHGEGSFAGHRTADVFRADSPRPRCSPSWHRTKIRPCACGWRG